MPQLRMRNAAGVLKTITRVRMRDAGGVLRTIQRIRIRDAGGVLRTVFQYLTATLNSYTAYGTASGAAASGSVTSASITATPTGGTAPYTYAWSRIDGSLAINITAPAVASTTFSATVDDTNSPYTGHFKCRITDTNGAVVDSDPVFVELYWFDTR